MRTPIIAGNWKMNTTVDEALDLVDEMIDDLEEMEEEVEVVLCPPFVSLAALADELVGSLVFLGAQNMHYLDKGAYTGEISPVMLADLCDYVILGHSERRQYCGETDELVNKKVVAALRHGLSPIVCVGETLAQHDAGQAEAVVTAQVKGCLAGLSDADVAGLVIAYEPVWAIGTGRAATGADANAVIVTIRQTIAGLYDAAIAKVVRVQYGGSVNAANIAEFIRQPEIDGALVGGASLKAEEFVAIVRQTAAIKGQKL
jgi:triosephosphate isomerase